MRGFWLLALLYAASWTLFLVPGAVLVFRRAKVIHLPDDDPLAEEDRWMRRLARDLRDRSQGEVSPDEVPVRAAPGGRRARLPAPAAESWDVMGPLSVPEGTFVAEGLIVSGDLRVAAGGRLLSPAWVRGSVVIEEGARTSALIAEGDVDLGSGAEVDGPIAASGEVRLAEEARVAGTVKATGPVTLGPGSVAGSVIAPFVRGGPLPEDAIEVAPFPDPDPIPEMEWTPELDAVLDELWPEGSLLEIVDAFHDRTGVDARGIHLLRRARVLDLLDRGVPRRPRMLGRRPAWVLTSEVVRVGADLRVPPDEIVSYSFVVEGALEIFHDAVIEGPVRSGRGLLLHNGAVIHGQATSDGLVVCEEGAAVLGPVDSSMHVLLFTNARVGTPGFGGVHAKGAIGLEPGSEIVGHAIAGLGVRGEPLRPEPMRIEAADVEPPARGKEKKRRRRRRRRAPLKEAEVTAPVEVVEAEEASEPDGTDEPPRPRGGRRRRSGRKPKEGR